MGLFRKAKPAPTEPDERDEAEHSYRLFKLVSRAWGADPQPETDLRYKSELT